MNANKVLFPSAKVQPTQPQLIHLMDLKREWLATDGTSKKAAQAFNVALAQFGESEELGLFFLPA